ncbi:DUF4345 domain-containing protein [Adhaeribacter sp. BT258]|uniref:DUF4345 domain-containing protein n=1 Tax=Adhaeribacter terrigena TaxID=2793070 RepID=A0ABS1C576_9BACT|nr:DUF4345 domain-containing protein [Adhaeribacter terrigena]MBK0404332.1 DUF4345 domain-containing protein [Adhaeribacter terrigena]
MKKQKTMLLAAKGFILLSALSLLSVSVMAFFSPQAVMDLVQVKLENTDAYSSIRGVYGGVGMTLVISLIYLMLKEPRKGLAFLMLLWGFYAFSRTITIFAEGSLGAFGTQWLVIEAAFFLIAGTLFMLTGKNEASKTDLQVKLSV